jgi:hypothetical protein
MMRSAEAELTDWSVLSAASDNEHLWQFCSNGLSRGIHHFALDLRPNGTGFKLRRADDSWQSRGLPSSLQGYLSMDRTWS